MVDGFKNTEVGYIPNDWELTPIGDVSHIFGRIGFRGYTVNDIVKSNEGAVTISPSNIQDGKMNFTKCTYISWFKYEESPEIKIFDGDILLVKTGSTFGKTAIVSGLKEKATINPQIVVLKKIRIDNLFLGYIMGFEVVQNQIKTSIVGGAIPTLSQKQVASFLIPLPPTKAEQAAIATALYNTDALIQKLEQLIDKKRNIKTGAMQELLNPKAGWEEKQLGEAALLKARIGWQGLTTAEYKKSGGYYLITGTEFKNGYIDWANCFYVDENRYKQDKYIQIREHDVLVTKDGTIGKVALIKHLPKPATLNSGVFVIRPMENSFHPEFFYYLLLSNVFAIFLSQLSAGSTINHLYQKDFVTFKFKQPKTIDEQVRIARILSDMDNEIQELEKQLDKYKMLKQGMMQSLLTGKIRLV